MQLPSYTLPSHFFSLASRLPSSCPFVRASDIWGGTSIQSTVKIRKTWQWRMTRCQLKALTKDRVLFPLSLSSETQSASPHTNARKAISATSEAKRKEKKKIKSVVTRLLPRPRSAATSNCGESSLCIADKFVLSRASETPNAGERYANAWRTE